MDTSVGTPPSLLCTENGSEDEHTKEQQHTHTHTHTVVNENSKEQRNEREEEEDEEEEEEDEGADFDVFNDSCVLQKPSQQNIVEFNKTIEHSDTQMQKNSTEVQPKSKETFHLCYDCFICAVFMQNNSRHFTCFLRMYELMERKTGCMSSKQICENLLSACLTDLSDLGWEHKPITTTKNGVTRVLSDVTLQGKSIKKDINGHFFGIGRQMCGEPSYLYELYIRENIYTQVSTVARLPSDINVLGKIIGLLPSSTAQTSSSKKKRKID